MYIAQTFCQRSVYQTRASPNTQNCCSFPFENPFLIWCRRLIIQIKHPRKLFTVKTHILVKLLPNTKNQTLNNIQWISCHSFQSYLFHDNRITILIYFRNSIAEHGKCVLFSGQKKRANKQSFFIDKGMKIPNFPFNVCVSCVMRPD